MADVTPTDDQLVDLALRLPPDRKKRLLDALRQDEQRGSELVDKGGVLAFRGAATGSVERALDEFRNERAESLLKGINF